MCFIVVLMHWNWCFWDWLYPYKSIEKCPDISMGGEHGAQPSPGGGNSGVVAARAGRFNYSS